MRECNNREVKEGDIDVSEISLSRGVLIFALPSISRSNNRYREVYVCQQFSRRVYCVFDPHYREMKL